MTNDVDKSTEYTRFVRYCRHTGISAPKKFVIHYRKAVKGQQFLRIISAHNVGKTGRPSRQSSSITDTSEHEHAKANDHDTVLYKRHNGTAKDSAALPKIRQFGMVRRMFCGIALKNGETATISED